MASTWKHLLCFTFIFLGISLLGLFVASADISKGLPRAGDVIPGFSIPFPDHKTFQSYLMLEEGGMFQPAEMDVKLLLIEVLNVY